MSRTPVTAEELAEAARIEWMGEILPASRAVDLMRRLASDLTAERATSARLADKVLDLGRELEALRDAVRAHEASVRAGPHSRCWDQADLDLWAAAKA